AQRRGQSLDFSFLDRPAGFRIAGSTFRPSDTIFEALLVGVKNTLLVAGVGIVLAMMLGLVVGIARLSTNWLVARVAMIYVEAIRNIPLLVIIFFWSAAVILKMPRIDDPATLPGLILSNRGLWIPWFVGRERFRPFLALLLIAFLVAAVVWVWRTRRSETTGLPHRRLTWSVVVFVGIALVSYVALGDPVVGTLPQRSGRAITGGFTILPSFAALLAALVVYTASHIGEIVRGSIQAVAKGQTEAALALGFSPTQRLRLVILPQAFRVATPQLANQFLNLTKNSSLGIAVAYAELMTLAQVSIANGSPAPQTIAILMLFYLAMSLSIAALTNVVNRRLDWAAR
ncbi:MAG: ABC transporter permease subunit, partial [Actinomycetota bacterium]